MRRVKIQGVDWDGLTLKLWYFHFRTFFHIIKKHKIVCNI